MAVKNVVKAIDQQVILAPAFTGAFQAINPNGIEHPCFLLRIVNNSNQDLFISYDGVTAHDFLQDGAVLELPVQTNAQPNNYTALFAKGTVVYVSAAAGLGAVYLAGYYQPEQ